MPKHRTAVNNYVTVKTLKHFMRNEAGITTLRLGERNSCVCNTSHIIAHCSLSYRHNTTIIIIIIMILPLYMGSGGVIISTISTDALLLYNKINKIRRHYVGIKKHYHHHHHF